MFLIDVSWVKFFLQFCLHAAVLWFSCGFTLNARLHNGMGDKTVNLCALLISVGNHSSFFEIK